eukprot:352768_1
MMSKINQTDIDRLIELVGGRGNIATVSHCITRLRFVLNQPANARPKEIEQLPMVKGCFTNAGQFQVVIGTNVGDYYQALIASTGQEQVDKEQVKKAARQNMKWHEQLISHFAEIFFPLLPALISGGLILGFRNVIGDLPMSNGQTLAQMYPSLQTIYDFLWLIGEAIFFYLPVGICWSAVKKMGGTPILGIVLGVTLVSPQLMNAYLLGQQLPEVWDFGMFSIAKVGYQAQVIPALLAGLALGVIETRLKRIVPDYLYLVVVPVCSLILAVFQFAPVNAMFTDTVVVHHRTAEANGFFTDDLVERIVVLVDFLFRLTVNDVVIVDEVHVGAVLIAMRGMTAQHGDVVGV